MAFLPSLPAEAKMPDVQAAFDDPLALQREFANRVMTGPSALSLGDRELIAAFVSHHNACQYCFGVHEQVAANHGVSPDLLKAVAQDPETAPVEARWKPLFRYLAKVTTEPSKVVQRDVDAVLDAGWDERTLFDALMVCCYYNFLNRMVDGCGVRADGDYFAVAGERLAERGRASAAQEGRGAA
ncbi:MAG: peroxidase-related enzyme [Alphaproteobacteria bacterium]